MENNKLKFILIFILFILSSFMINPVYSKYTSKCSGTINLNIRKPNYNVIFNSNAPTNSSVTGSMNKQSFVYGTAQKLTPLAYSINNYEFVKWKMLSNNNYIYFLNNESVNNLSSTDNENINLYAVWNYIETPTITKTDYNTFTYSANNAFAYYISKSNTLPSAGTNTPSNSFALNTWTTATNTGDLTLSAGEIYYVFIKDIDGNVSKNYAYINVRTITKNIETGSSLTIKLNNSSGSNAPNYVLNGTIVYVSAGINSGYHSPILKQNNSNATNNTTYTINQNTTFTSSATANTVSITIKKDNALWNDSGMKITLYSGTTATSHTATVTSGNVANIGTVPNGTYNVYAGKDSSNKTTLIDTGLDVTINNNSTSGTINYYSVNVNKGTGISSITNGGTNTTTKQYLYKNNGTQQSVAINATVSAGYNWSKWTSSDITLSSPTSISQSFTLPNKVVSVTATTTPNLLANQSGLKVGDYVNYPVSYTNPVITNKFDSTYKYQAKGTGWKVLSIEKNSNGTKYVRLVSAGVPLSYCHDNTATANITNMTTNFLNTPINSTYTNETFRKCGIKDANGNTISANDKSQLYNAFMTNNSYTSSVSTLTLDDLITIGGATLESDGLSYVLKKNTTLFKINVETANSTSEVKYAGYFLASRKNTGGKYYLWTVARQSGEIVYTYKEQGIRPVVTLKTDVKTSGKNTNGTWILVP